jgi:hypothetical protein
MARRSLRANLEVSQRIPIEEHTMTLDAPLLSLEVARQVRAQQIADAEDYRIAREARTFIARSRLSKGRSRGRPTMRHRTV